MLLTELLELGSHCIQQLIAFDHAGARNQKERQFATKFATSEFFFSGLNHRWSD